MKLDIHSHILPGLDDGAKDIEDALMLTRALESWGFERVTCTPHIREIYPNSLDDIKKAFDTLQEAVNTNNINIQLRMSAEYRLNPETWPEVLAKGQLMPIEDRYILMELPISNLKEMGDIKPIEEFRKVIALGLTPILPHPERYSHLSRKELLHYVDEGVLIQCNYGSLSGIYGHEVKTIAEDIIKEGIVSFYATDLHNAFYVKNLTEWFNNGNAIQEFVTTA